MSVYVNFNICWTHRRAAAVRLWHSADCCTEENCRLFWILEAKRGEEQILNIWRNKISAEHFWVTFSGALLTWSSQFCQNTSGTQRRTDTGGGCWFCSSYISTQTYCSLKRYKKQNKAKLHLKHLFLKTVITKVHFAIRKTKKRERRWTYKLSCVRRRHKTLVSCSSGPWTCEVCRWLVWSALQEAIHLSPPPLPPHRRWNTPADRRGRRFKGESERNARNAFF